MHMVLGVKRRYTLIRGRTSRTFSVRFTEDIKLARDMVDEGLIDRFEETVRVWVRLGDLGR